MKQKIVTSLLMIYLLFSHAACKKEKELYKDYTFAFNTGIQGWKPLFSDYPVGEEAFYELEFGHYALPHPLDPSQKALRVSGNNHSDDLLSMIYKKLDGLKPNKQYAVYFKIELASNSAINAPGAGGSPDLSLGAGGLSYEPANKVEDVGGVDYYRPNFVSEIQSHQSNQNFRVVGSTGVTDTTTQYALITRHNANDPIYLTSNNKGELWLLIGTDSGYEGRTTLYYRSIHVQLKD